MLIEMRVASVTVDPFTSMPIVVLKDGAGKQSVAIWIGMVEASAIATELDRIELDRPMTHDLMATMLERCGVRAVAVDIHDLRDNTFYATVHLEAPGQKPMAIDARPSDAIALALRTGAPIRVAQKVIDRARKIDLRFEPPPIDLRRDARPQDPEVGLPAPPPGAAGDGDGDSLATERNDRDDRDDRDDRNALHERHDGAIAGGPGGGNDEYATILASLSDGAFGKWKM